MKRPATFFFYLLAAYVFLQFSWWAYHIIQLTKEVDTNQALVNKRIGMIIGEGLVFFMILSFGMWRIIRSIKRESELANRQRNFLLSVTHELKTPLASTKLYLQTLLKRNFDQEKREELLHKTLRENQRLEEIVEALLLSARIENKSLELTQETIDVEKELHLLAERLSEKYNGLNLTFVIAKDTKMFTDLFMFKTIFLNILENAVKYGGANNPITLEVVNHDGLLFRVSDNGPGIPSEQLNSIFDKFVRLQNEETRTQKGTGLGLFIVKEFCRMSGASITYKANQPSGSIFEIQYPDNLVL